MRCLFPCVGVLLALTSGSFNKTGRSQLTDDAVVHGVVTDSADSRISGVTLTFTRTGEKSSVVTKADGSYSIQLVPGVYAVAANLSYFCPLHRSDISVSTKAKVQLDLQMNLCGIVDPVEVTVIEPTKDPSSPWCRGPYCEEKLKAMGPSQIQPVVIYHEREEGLEDIVYRGLKIGSSYVAPEFTFNLITLRARTLKFRPAEKRLEATGDVKWQDGFTSWRGQEISISLKSDGNISIISKQ